MLHDSGTIWTTREAWLGLSLEEPVTHTCKALFPQLFFDKAVPLLLGVIFIFFWGVFLSTFGETPTLLHTHWSWHSFLHQNNKTLFGRGWGSKTIRRTPPDAKDDNVLCPIPSQLQIMPRVKNISSWAGKTAQWLKVLAVTAHREFPVKRLHFPTSLAAGRAGRGGGKFAYHFSVFFKGHYFPIPLPIGILSSTCLALDLWLNFSWDYAPWKCGT